MENNEVSQFFVIKWYKVLIDILVNSFMNNSFIMKIKIKSPE